MVKVNANSLKPGNVIEHQSKLWRVVKSEHVKPGKGGAFCQMELKELKHGTKLNERFRSTEDLEQVRLDQTDYQYLYEEDDNIVVMDPNTYDQKPISKDLLGEQLVFLQDGMIITVEASDTETIGATVPEKVVLEITETEAVVKGQTAASSNKPATLENGIRVMVPPFLSVGDKIVVNTQDQSYVERAKD